MDPTRVEENTRLVLNPGAETSEFVTKIFDKRLFPRFCPIDSVLSHLERKQLWSSDRSKWRTPADSQLEHLFNRILHHLPYGHVDLSVRRWLRKGAYEGSNGFSSTIRKSYLVLCDPITLSESKTWKPREFKLREYDHIFGVMKKENSADNLNASFLDLVRKVAWRLENREGDYTTPGIQLLGNDIIFTLFGRGGSISTPPLDMHKYPKEFLRILLGVTLCNGLIFGSDLTPRVNWGLSATEDEVRWNISFDNLPIVFGSLYGRGTMVRSGVVAQAESPGLARDVNMDSRATPMGVEMSSEDRINGVTPPIHENQAQTSHSLDTINLPTYILCSKVMDPPSRNYELRVLSPLISPPEGESWGLAFDFSSLAELLIGFIDCLQAHLHAVNGGVLHRHVGLSNLLFVTLAEGENRNVDFLRVLSDDERARLEAKIMVQTVRRAVLVDWGYAAPVQKRNTDDKAPEESEIATKPRDQINGKEEDNLEVPSDEEPPPNGSTRTRACPVHSMWIAAELTVGTSVAHMPHHDLESFFYVLHAICFMYDAPRTIKPSRQFVNGSRSFFHAQQPSYAKATDIESSSRRTRPTLPQISPYFWPLTPLLQRLQNEVVSSSPTKNPTFDTKPPLTHAMFASALIEALVELPDICWDYWTHDDEPDGGSTSAECGTDFDSTYGTSTPSSDASYDSSFYESSLPPLSPGGTGIECLGENECDPEDTPDEAACRPSSLPRGPEFGALGLGALQNTTEQLECLTELVTICF